MPQQWPDSIELCSPTPTLGGERWVLGGMFEYLTFTLRGLEDGHPELFFWRYLDTDGKDDRSGEW